MELETVMLREAIQIQKNMSHVISFVDPSSKSLNVSVDLEMITGTRKIERKHQGRGQEGA